MLDKNLTSSPELFEHRYRKQAPLRGGRYGHRSSSSGLPNNGTNYATRAQENGIHDRANVNIIHSDPIQNLYSSSPLRHVKSTALRSSSPGSTGLSRMTSTQYLRGRYTITSNRSDDDIEHQLSHRRIKSRGTSREHEHDRLFPSRHTERSESSSYQGMTEDDLYERGSDVDDKPETLWEAVEELRSRVLKLEMLERDRIIQEVGYGIGKERSSYSSLSEVEKRNDGPSVSRTMLLLNESFNGLRILLDQCQNDLPKILFVCLEQMVQNLEILALDCLPNSKTAHEHFEVLCGSIIGLIESLLQARGSSSPIEPSEISKQFHDSMNDNATAIDIANTSHTPNSSAIKDTGVAFSSRLPERAASRMKVSLEIGNYSRPSSRVSSVADKLESSENRSISGQRRSNQLLRPSTLQEDSHTNAQSTQNSLQDVSDTNSSKNNHKIDRNLSTSSSGDGSSSVTDNTAFALSTISSATVPCSSTATLNNQRLSTSSDKPTGSRASVGMKYFLPGLKPMRRHSILPANDTILSTSPGLHTTDNNDNSSFARAHSSTSSAALPASFSRTVLANHIDDFDDYETF
ncbi:hypothetical protein V1511DRAFT_512858 [Dipodascopsis uninucleata]